MKTFLSVLIWLTLFLPSYSPAAARGASEIRILPSSRVLQTFRLEVRGKPAPGTTFWVAYGPLAGRFGVIQLHRIGPSAYATTAQLPGRGETTFAYLRAHGVAHTREGRVPGDPVLTIKTIGPVSVPDLNLPTVLWRAPSS